MTISVVMPCYKEADNLKVILPKLKNILSSISDNCEILVVDTIEAMDDTAQVCKDCNDLDEPIKIRHIRREGGNLYGDAIRTGINSAIGEYIVIMDADGSHNPKDIVRLYKECHDNTNDVVIGSRYIKGGNTHNSFILKMMSYVLNFTYRVYFGLKVMDVSNSYRIYRSDKLKSIKLESDNFDLVEEILIKLKTKYPNIIIKEIPVYFNKRVYGESKRDLIKFIFSYIATMYRLKKLQKNG